MPGCTVCQEVKGVYTPAYRRITEEDDEVELWFCLNCEMAGVDFSKQFVEIIKRLYGDSFGWEEFVMQWSDEVNPLKD